METPAASPDYVLRTRSLATCLTFVCCATPSFSVDGSRGKRAWGACVARAHAAGGGGWWSPPPPHNLLSPPSFSCGMSDHFCTSATVDSIPLTLPPPRPPLPRACVLAAAAGKRPRPRGRTLLVGRLRRQQGHPRGERRRRGRRGGRWRQRVRLRRRPVGERFVPWRRRGRVSWCDGGGDYEDEPGGDQRLHGPGGIYDACVLCNMCVPRPFASFFSALSRNIVFLL